MRSYLAVFFGALGLTVSIAALAIGLSCGVPVEESLWTSAALAKKLALAARIDGPKIVLLSGSNAHVGLKAEMIAAATHRPAVNLATNAGLGPQYLFYSAKSALRPGDIVILALEYEM